MYVPPAAPGAPSHLLFLRGEALFAQPLDANSLTVRGKAVTVVPRVSELADRKSRRSVTASATGILVYRPGEYVSTVELAWVDRTGKRQETLSDPFPTWGSNAAIRLSPDDTKALVPVLKGDKLDMWIADLSRKTMSRLTFHGSNSAIWSPDGKKALWAAFDGSRYLRAADGSGGDELLYRNRVEKSGFPTDWSSDGKLIAFSEMPRDHGEIWLASVGGQHHTYPYIQAGHTQAWGQFSPNNRWMAYVDFQSPLPAQVVVESIPAGRQHWHISPEGGDWPIWRRDGKELFYSWDNRLMVVAVRESGGLVEFGAPQKLFEFQNTISRFQVSRDGKRFLVALPAETSSDRAPLTVDTDWRAGLEK
jgi:Tol biopolymer transport system component